MRLYGEVLKTCSRDLLSSFRRSRTLGIKQLWVAWLVRPPGDSWDCSSMKWQDIWTHYTETAGGGGGRVCRYGHGNASAPTQTGHENQATGDRIPSPALTSRHTQWNHWIEKWENLSQKKFTSFWKKEVHSPCLRSPLKYILQGPSLSYQVFVLSAWITFSQNARAKNKTWPRKVNFMRF